MDTFTYVARDLISGANATGVVTINVTRCPTPPIDPTDGVDVVNATDRLFVLKTCTGGVNFTGASLAANATAPPSAGALTVTGVTAVTPPGAGTLSGPDGDGVYTFVASGTYQGAHMEGAAPPPCMCGPGCCRPHATWIPCHS